MGKSAIPQFYSFSGKRGGSRCGKWGALVSYGLSGCLESGYR